MLTASIRKETQLLLRDRGRLLSLFALPVIFISLFGFMFHGNSNDKDPISSFQITVPDNAVLFGFFIAMAVAMSFASERHSGTWRRLLASPVPRYRALLGKLVPYYLISIVQLAFLFGIGAGAFHMQVAGSVLGLVAATLALSLCAVAFGMFVASFGGTEKQIGSVVPLVLMVMGLVSGCMFPRMFMPDALKQASLAVPQAWALDAYTALLVHPGTSLADVAPQLAAVLGFAVLFAGLGIWRFRFER